MIKAALHNRVTPLNLDAVRADFPILARPIYGQKRLAYLDTAASAQKPRAVIDATRLCYEEEYANIHRGVYYLSQKATEKFEAARNRVRRFLNAREDREIIFTRSATESINLLAQTFGRGLGPGDEIILSELEHHSNIVPWQLLRDEKGVTIKVIPIDENGDLDMAAYERLLGPKTKLVAVTHISNAIGTITPVERIIALAHQAGARVMLDGSQAAPHMRVDVAALDCDFYVFTGHKVYGPTGIGVLYGKADLLSALPPWQGGGDMIRSVSFKETVYAEIPARFEAGTPNIAGAIGLGAAIDYLDGLEIDAVADHERLVRDYALDVLKQIPGVRVVGNQRHRANLVSFVCDDMHPHDVGTILDREGVAVRAGHHCAQPLMDRLGVVGTLRASIGVYNGFDDIDALAAGLAKARKILIG